LSSDAVTMREPSGLNAADPYGALMTAQNCHFLCRRDIPDGGGLIF
jgi:hypothetical protein